MNNDEKMVWLTQNADRIIIVLRNMSEVDAMLEIIESTGNENKLDVSVERLREIFYRYIITFKDKYVYIRPTDTGFSYGPSDTLAAKTLEHIEFKDFMYGSIAKPVSLINYMEEAI